MHEKLSSIVIIGFVVIALTGCKDKKPEFSEMDFEGGTKMFCQYSNYKGSPLRANTYLLYYNKESGLANIGQYVYSAWKDTDKAGLGHVHTTTRAIATDSTLLFNFEHRDSGDNTIVTIDRKTLSGIKDSNKINCEIVSSETLENKNKDLVKDHERYLKTLDKNKI